MPRTMRRVVVRPAGGFQTMRILLASDSFDPAVGGVQRVVKDLALTLARRGHVIGVLAPWAQGLATREVIDGLDVHRVRLGRPALRARAVAGFAGRIGAARAAADAIAAGLRPDLVHLHFLQSPLAYLLPRLCARRDLPLVATAHGRDVVGDMVEGDLLGRRIVRRVLAAAAAVTAPSVATLSDARALAPTRARARFVVVPNGLPLDMTAELDRVPSTSGRGIVAVGELHPKKGFDVLIRALADVPDARLRIAGRGCAHDELVALAAASGVADRVEFVGFVARADLPRFLRSGAVQAVPSRSEPFGLVIVEGFACGVPVIASRTGGIPDVVGAGGAALLVPPDDPAALAAALSALLAHPERRATLAAAARVRVADLTVERTADAYESLYRGVVVGV